MMKIDLYTKLVLTVIAISVSIIAYRNIEFIPSTRAHSMNLALNTPLDVNIVSVPYNGIDVNVNNKIKVDTPYGGLDVNVKIIKSPSKVYQ
ncbi:hypothetical protein [Bacteroides acidifaciens]|uniref:hypothetical protein n=1 Tax=Bacteroides acidifaciens TaxID=85831 RepID=UPI00158851FA|nr:hypothetical protein [Bacteroides acidifaciens]